MRPRESDPPMEENNFKLIFQRLTLQATILMSTAACNTMQRPKSSHTKCENAVRIPRTRGMDVCELNTTYEGKKDNVPMKTVYADMMLLEERVQYL